MNDEFKNLLKLLDDDNEQSASRAMAQLLSTADERLERVLRVLQETSNPKLRRRIHQLQSAILRRRKRLVLAQRLRKKELSLYDGIVQLHLFWFDNDTAPEVDAQWNDFVRESGTQPLCSIREIFPFLRKKIAICRGPGEGINADAVCIGTIMEDGEAADFMACAMAHLLGEKRGVSAQIVSTVIGGAFGLLENNTFYAACRNWQDFRPEETGPLRFWKDSELLTLLASTLFYNAVSTDGYRYIHTLGCCLAKTTDISFLPYPYGRKD